MEVLRMMPIGFGVALMVVMWVVGVLVGMAIGGTIRRNQAMRIVADEAMQSGLKTVAVRGLMAARVTARLLGDNPAADGSTGSYID